MEVDPALLDTARQAAERVRAAEAAVERARLSHREAVRALNAGGASLRAIAAALGLSHQRVHQLVTGDGEEAGPRLAAKRRAGPLAAPAGPVEPEVSCLLCGEGGTDAICAPCRAAARRIVAGESLDGTRGLRPAFRHHRRPCGLCERLPDAGERFAQGPAAAVCGACL